MSNSLVHKVVQCSVMFLRKIVCATRRVKPKIKISVKKNDLPPWNVKKKLFFLWREGGGKQYYS